MDKAEITQLQQQSVAQITKRLDALARADLVELAAQEAASDTPRATLQAAIDKQLAALDEPADENHETPPAVDAAAVEPAAKPAGKIGRDDYRHPDYSGPLDGAQADWRLHHIKPADRVRAK